MDLFWICVAILFFAFCINKAKGAGSPIAATPYAKLSEQIRVATKDGTLPLVLRTYEATEKGNQVFADEAQIFTANGYEPANMTEEGGHIHAGRLLLTGGFSVFAGQKGIRAGGKRTVTWKKVAQ